VESSPKHLEMPTRMTGLICKYNYGNRQYDTIASGYRSVACGAQAIGTDPLFFRCIFMGPFGDLG